ASCLLSSFLPSLRLYLSTCFFFFFYSSVHPRDLHSFPTRRSSDLPFNFNGSKMASHCWLILEPTPMCKCSTSRNSFPRSSSATRSEEHTSELQSRFDLVCRLLLEKKNRTQNKIADTTTHDTGKGHT